MTTLVGWDGQTCERCGSQIDWSLQRWHKPVCGPCDNPVAARRFAYQRRMAARACACPVTEAERKAVIESGPCVYCGSKATTADHVRPITSGGLDELGNLAPACNPCNASKHGRYLTEWDPVRVAHAVACSPIVAAEYDRLTKRNGE